jgi:hypothetical protein
LAIGLRRDRSRRIIDAAIKAVLRRARDMLNEEMLLLN